MNKSLSVIPLLLALFSCADSTPRAINNAGRSETGQPALHAVQDDQLRGLMDRMNSLMQERFLTEPELDVERRKYAQQISKTAQNLLPTIDAVLASLGTLKLSKEEENTFQALAQKLRKQTHTLQEQAAQNRLDAISSTLEQMNSTCISCHSLFRKR